MYTSNMERRASGHCKSPDLQKINSKWRHSTLLLQRKSVGLGVVSRGHFGGPSQQEARWEDDWRYGHCVAQPRAGEPHLAGTYP